MQRSPLSRLRLIFAVTLFVSLLTGCYSYNGNYYRGGWGGGGIGVVRGGGWGPGLGNGWGHGGGWGRGGSFGVATYRGGRW